MSSSTAQIQYLIGQDMKSVRGLEELRTGARRHESNIQLLTNQIGEFRLQVQDQMNSIRTHFSQTVNEFYQKIVERQNAMSYRLSSVVDELSAVKGKGKIFVKNKKKGMMISVSFETFPSIHQRRPTNKRCFARRLIYFCFFFSFLF